MKNENNLINKTNRNTYLSKIGVFALTALFAMSNFAPMILAQDETDKTANQTSSQLSAPANDDFVNAQIISGPSGNLIGNNNQATKEAGEPFHAGNRGGASVWYKWMAPITGNMKISVLGSYGYEVSVYTGSDVNNLKLIAANRRSNNEGDSTVTFGTQSATIYYIAVDGKFYNGSAKQGNFPFYWAYGSTLSDDNFSSPSGLNPLGVYVNTNAGATKEAGEPNHAGNAGGKSVWFQFYSFPYASSYTISTRGSIGIDGSPNMDTLLAVYKGSNINNLTLVAANDDFYGHTSQVTFTAPANTHYYIAVDGYNGATGNINLTWNITDGTQSANFDGDDLSDISVFRPSDGNWYDINTSENSVSTVHWGISEDKPVQGDYDNDGKTDRAVFRPSNGTWYISRSSDQSFSAINFGLGTDVPAAGDYDGNGQTDIAVFRPSDGTWHIANQNTIKFGQNGDVPAPADYDGDNKTDIAVFRPSDGIWYILQSSNGQAVGKQFGLNGDKPVAADYDGDGLADIAVFRPSTNVWYICQSSDNATKATQWGIGGDIPVPAKYNYVYKADVAVFRPSNSTWYIMRAGAQPTFIQFGTNGDVPATAAYQIP
ncbi:MAG TPA: VCBS repeat-containing protein [Pyrinomonadaceae bacterium]